MENESDQIKKVFNNLLEDLNLKLRISDDDKYIIKKITSENKKKEISKIDYYTKRYLRYFNEINISTNYDFNLAYLERSFEDLFFQNLVSLNTKRISHYTSFQSLMKILNKGEIRLSSIAGLNDRDELNYFDLNSDREIKDAYHYKRIQAFNSRFLISCSSLNDELNQWRLYGDDGRGVSIDFEVKEEKIPGFYLGKVLYGTSIIDGINGFIEELYRKYKIAFVFNRFGIWKHFFKSKDWDYEKEARIIHWDDSKSAYKFEWDVNKFGILSKYQYVNIKDMPIKLVGITLGPKISENELNIAQIKEYLRENNLSKTISDLKLSHIKCYR